MTHDKSKPLEVPAGFKATKCVRGYAASEHRDWGQDGRIHVVVGACPDEGWCLFARNGETENDQMLTELVRASGLPASAFVRVPRAAPPSAPTPVTLTPEAQKREDSLEALAAIGAGQPECECDDGDVRRCRWANGDKGEDGCWHNCQCPCHTENQDSAAPPATTKDGNK